MCYAVLVHFSSIEHVENKDSDITFRCPTW